MSGPFGKILHKKCCCEGIRCCNNRPCPSEGAVNPLPESLTVELSATFAGPPSVTPPGSGFTPPDNSDCFDFDFTVYLVECGDIITYAGEGEHSCTWCEQSYTIRVSVILTCAAEDGQWIMTFEALTPSGDCDLDFSGDQYRVLFETSECDPVLMTGDVNQCFDCGFTCQIGAIMIPPGVLVPVIATHSPFCISATVYETP